MCKGSDWKSNWIVPTRWSGVTEPPLLMGTQIYFKSIRGLVSGQILKALVLTSKTKKRSSKSDYYY